MLTTEALEARAIEEVTWYRVFRRDTIWALVMASTCGRLNSALVWGGRGRGGDEEGGREEGAWEATFAKDWTLPPLPIVNQPLGDSGRTDGGDRELQVVLPRPALAPSVLPEVGFITPPLREEVPVRPRPNLASVCASFSAGARTASCLQVQMALSSPSASAIALR